MADITMCKEKDKPIKFHFMILGMMAFAGIQLYFLDSGYAFYTMLIAVTTSLGRIGDYLRLIYLEK